MELQILTLALGFVAGAVIAWLLQRRAGKRALERSLAEHHAELAHAEKDAERRLHELVDAHIREQATLCVQQEAELDARERKLRRQLDEAAARELRERRLDAYQALWTQLDLLAVHHPRDDLRYADLVELGSELREWYFSGNGLLLSRAATDAFVAVQDALTLALRAVGHDGLHQLLRSKQTTYTLSEVARLELTEGEWTPGQDSASDYHELRRRFDDLRARLGEDVGSRSAFGAADALRDRASSEPARIPPSRPRLSERPRAAE